MALVTLVRNKGPPKLLGEWMSQAMEGTTFKLCCPSTASAQGLLPFFLPRCGNSCPAD